MVASFGILYLISHSQIRFLKQMPTCCIESKLRTLLFKGEGVEERQPIEDELSIHQDADNRVSLSGYVIKYSPTSTIRRFEGLTGG